VSQGDPGAIDTVIRYLEADPWAFGTGYTKEKILGSLKHRSFTQDQAARLRAVILNQVDGPQRREFRRYSLLAPRVADEAFRTALLARLRSREAGRARKALWVLDHFDEPLEPSDAQIAREIIEELAGSGQSWRAYKWLPQAIRRHRDPAWCTDQRHPGSRTFRPIDSSPRLTISIRPWSSVRISSGRWKLPDWTFAIGSAYWTPDSSL
jgi:hypothetical protein